MSVFLPVMISPWVWLLRIFVLFVTWRWLLHNLWWWSILLINFAVWMLLRWHSLILEVPERYHPINRLLILLYLLYIFLGPWILMHLILVLFGLLPQVHTNLIFTNIVRTVVIQLFLLRPINLLNCRAFWWVSLRNLSAVARKWAWADTLTIVNLVMSKFREAIVSDTFLYRCSINFLCFESNAITRVFLFILLFVFFCEAWQSGQRLWAIGTWDRIRILWIFVTFDWLNNRRWLISKHDLNWSDFVAIECRSLHVYNICMFFCRIFSYYLVSA